MRYQLLSFGFGVFCAVLVCGQSNAPAGPPGLSVLQYRWEKHTSNGMKYSQPTPTAVGQVVENVPDRPVVNWPYGTSYFYYIRIKNDGLKVIRSMALDYVFNDPDSKSELGRRTLNSFEKIDLNKMKWIEVRAVPFGPPKLATVEGIKKDRRSPFDEHIEIKCVLYTDGTGWKAPDAEAKTCNELVRLTLHPDARR
jgi:hypothetical protein